MIDTFRGGVLCATGVGCIVGAPAMVAGGAMVAHGATMATGGLAGFVQNSNSLINAMSSNEGSGGGNDFTRLSKGEINTLIDAGYHPHDLKPPKRGSRYDIFKDENGDLYVMPKNGSGPGEPLGLNINDLWE